MLATSMPRKPTPMLAMWAVGARGRVGPHAFGNAVGSQGFQEVDASLNLAPGAGGPTLDPNYNGGTAPKPGQIYTDAGWWDPSGQSNPDGTVQLAANDKLTLTGDSVDGGAYWAAVRGGAMRDPAIESQLAAQGQARDSATQSQLYQSAPFFTPDSELEARASQWVNAQQADSAPLPMEPLTPTPLSPSIDFQPITIEVSPAVSAVASGVGDVAKGAVVGLADITVAPILDLTQAGLKALHGAVTGDYQPLTPMSSYGDSVVNHGAGAWDGIKTTGKNVFNVSPVGMVYHAGTGGYGLTTALMDGDARAATREGLGLGLNFAGAGAVSAGMSRTPSTPFTANLGNATAVEEAVVGDNAAHSAYQYELLKRDLLRQEVANPGGSMSGPVVLQNPVAGATPAQVQQIRQYADLANLAIDEGYMSPTGRVSTTGSLRRQASAAAADERAAAAAVGSPYAGVVGHGPDTTWTGMPVAPFWLDMDSSINSSLGRQAQNYPLGYTPTRFVYQGDLNWIGNGNW